MDRFWRSWRTARQNSLPTLTGTKESVRDFWEAKPCGSVHASLPEGTLGYYAQIERRRYELEPFIPSFARFADACGKTVLEIGIGVGTDFVQFARAGARVTGVDLTERAVELVRRRLELEGLTGEVRRADAERLPFEDASFDVVYSWGVLHHTPDPDQAMREAMRVLTPGGRLCVMVYSRRSWVALGLWLRHGAMRGRPWATLSDVVAKHMESDGTRAYTRSEIRRAFPGLTDIRIDQLVTSYDRRVAGPLARAAGSRLGWFLVVTGRRRPPGE